jgi:hypothetical protein
MEMNHDWDKPIELADIDQLIKYNINDVLSTSELLTRCENDLKLRLDIETQYGISCLSKDGVGIGSEILKNKYLQKTQLEWKDIQNLRSPMDLIPLRDVILPQIEYNAPVLKELLKTLKNSTVSPGRKGIEKHFILDGVKVSVGVGGIHSKPKPSVIIPNEDELLLDTDAASLYPSLLIEYGFYPPHLGREFVEIYSGVKNERIEAKRNKDKGKDDTLKLALNAVTGNLQNEYSWMYSPFAVMQIRMNGQLLLLKLAEMLIEIGCTIIQYNTDGLFLICKKESKDLYDDTICKFEQFSRLVMETTEFKSMYQYAINDYLAVGSNDSIKEKGLFITKVTPGKGLTPKIIPKAIQAFLIHNIPIEKTILESSDIKDFLMSEKTGKQWTVEFHGIRQQRINRFYACKKGLNLFKWKELNTHIIQDSTPVVTLWGELKSVDIPLERQYQNMLSNSPVRILNVLEDKPIDSYAINYQYYITEARKIIDELIPKQLTLF